MKIDHEEKTAVPEQPAIVETHVAPITPPSEPTVTEVMSRRLNSRRLKKRLPEQMVWVSKKKLVRVLLKPGC
ncbi:MAG: hypothetical protein ACXABE_01715 [Candidatus Thorarchaeota archaeon]